MLTSPNTQDSAGNKEEVEAPFVGPYQLIKELKTDNFGSLYFAVKKNEQKYILLRLISPTITNQKNFLLRLELLKGVIPQLKHPNLLEVDQLTNYDKLYIIAYTLPLKKQSQKWCSLDNFKLAPSTLGFVQLEQTLSGVISAFEALKKFKPPFYKEGFSLTSPSLDEMFLFFEEPLVGQEKKIKFQLSAYLESFLFFGDEPLNLLQYKLHKNRELSSSSNSLLKNEWLSSPSTRNNQRVSIPDSLYTIAAILYWLVTNEKLSFPIHPLSHKAPLIDPNWDQLLKLCILSNEKTPVSIYQDLLSLIKQVASKRNAPDEKKQALSKLSYPSSMSLITLDGKVELGSSSFSPIEQPRFKVPIAPFIMDKCCVTNEQMQEFLPQYKASSFSSGPKQPATNISLNMAKAYCDYRSKKERLPIGAYRLPTEFEWEAACRGNTSQQYPWGDSFHSALCHCDQDEAEGSREVKSFAPGCFELFEMLGNVWEWTESRFKPHPFAEYIDPRYKHKFYTIKGGCWLTPAKELHASMRSAFPANERKSFLGFRCVLDPSFL
ncbi:MAG: SUMF1/EgtB/PvdO family nonheme iron enzyme [Chlamydiales bacterium]|nr:SUMF1/EgtB/PvdO family nonheme iron enzyme [Chlamydiales bacterium]